MPERLSNLHHLRRIHPIRKEVTQTDSNSTEIKIIKPSEANTHLQDNRKAHDGVEKEHLSQRAISDDPIEATWEIFAANPLNSDITPALNEIRIQLQNAAESFSVVRPWTDQEGQRQEGVEERSVELRHVRGLAIEDTKKVKAILGDQERKRKCETYVVGALEGTKVDDYVGEAIYQTLWNYATAREAILTGQSMHGTSRLPHLGEITNPYEIFDVKEIEALGRQGEKPSVPSVKKVGVTFEHYRMKGATDKRYHSMFIIKPAGVQKRGDDRREIHIWVANRSLDTLVQNVQCEIIGRFSPILPGLKVATSYELLDYAPKGTPYMHR